MRKLLYLLLLCPFASFGQQTYFPFAPVGSNPVSLVFRVKAVAPDSLDHYYLYNPLTQKYNEFYTAAKQNSAFINNNIAPAPQTRQNATFNVLNGSLRYLKADEHVYVGNNLGSGSYTQIDTATFKGVKNGHQVYSVGDSTLLHHLKVQYFPVDSIDAVRKRDIDSLNKLNVKLNGNNVYGNPSGTGSNTYQNPVYLPYVDLHLTYPGQTLYGGSSTKDLGLNSSFGSELYATYPNKYYAIPTIIGSNNGDYQILFSASNPYTADPASESIDIKVTNYSSTAIDEYVVLLSGSGTIGTWYTLKPTYASNYSNSRNATLEINQSASGIYQFRVRRNSASGITAPRMWVQTSPVYTVTPINTIGNDVTTLTSYPENGVTMADGNIYDPSGVMYPKTAGTGTVSNLTSTTTDITVANPTTTPAITLAAVNNKPLSYFDPTSSIQTQLNGKQATIGYTPYNATNPNNYVASPLTTNGDLWYYNSGNTRLPIGSTNQVLTVIGGLPVWQAPAAGFTNPMTSPGDLIYGGTSGAATRLAAGSTNQVLTIAGGVPTWTAPASTGLVSGYITDFNFGVPSSLTVLTGNKISSITDAVGSVTSTQATGASQPNYIPTGGPGNTSYANFAGAQTLAGALLTSSTNFTIFEVRRVVNNSGNFNGNYGSFQNGNTASAGYGIVDYQAYNVSGANSYVSGETGGFFPGVTGIVNPDYQTFANKWEVVVLSHGTGTSALYNSVGNKYTVTSASNPATPTGGHTIGTLNFGGVNKFVGDISRIIVYSSQLTDAQVLQNVQFLNQQLQPPNQYVADGDSRTVTTGGSPAYPTQVNNLIIQGNSPTFLKNVGVSGYLVDSVSAQFYRHVSNNFVKGATNVYTLMIGHNNFAAATNNTAAYVYPIIKTVCGYAHQAGYKVIICTDMYNSASVSAPINTQKDLLNASIRANWPTFADGMADINSIPQASQANMASTTYSADGVHPTGLLDSYIAPVVYKAIQNILNPVTPSNISGQVTLASGVATVTIPGVTTANKAILTFVSTGGTVSTTWQYSGVCTNNTLTITALTNTGATDTSDNSVLNYQVIN